MQWSGLAKIKNKKFFNKKVRKYLIFFICCNHFIVLKIILFECTVHKKLKYISFWIFFSNLKKIFLINGKIPKMEKYIFKFIMKHFNC